MIFDNIFISTLNQNGKQFGTCKLTITFIKLNQTLASHTLGIYLIDAKSKYSTDYESVALIELTHFF